MPTAIIIQARWGSSRLPGKVLLRLGERTVLDHVLTRARRIPGADVVVTAVPDETASDPVADEARRCGSVVFRGSESDVLARYLGAAHSVGADVVMRVTSDCPLIDPEVCGQVLTLRAADQADYAANNMPPTFPHGLDCEAFTTAALEEAARTTREPHDREHVTPWIRRAPHLRKVNVFYSLPHPNERWTLDYPEDLVFMRAVLALFPEGAEPGMEDVLAQLARRPDITSINAARHQPRT